MMLARQGHQVTVFTPWYPSLRTRAPRQEERDGITIRRLSPWLHFGNAGLMPQLAWLLKDFDVIHLHYPCIGGAEFAMSAAKEYGIPLITTYHMDLVGKGSWKRPIFRAYNKTMLSKMVTSSAKILVTSLDYARHSLLAHWLEKSPEKFVALPCSVDTAVFTPLPKNPELLKSLGIKDGDRVMLFVGGLGDAHYFKGITYLLDAFALVKKRVRDGENIKLVIVGEGNRKEEYKTCAKQLGIHDQVVFATAPSTKDLVAYYNIADVLVLPAIDSSEAFGIVLIEAMACGKPVIASRLPGVRSVVEEGESGLLTEPKNTEDLANKMETLLCNPALREAMGWRSLARAREKYSNTAVAARLAAVVSEMKVKKAL